MSKTNHQRGFEGKRFYHGQDRPRYTTWSGHGETPLSSKRVAAGSTIVSENSKSVRRDRAGAKKFVRSRTRFHENAALKKIIESADVNIS